MLDGTGGLTGLPDDLSSNTEARTAEAQAVIAGWASWASSVLAAPTGQSWHSVRLEHAFAAQAPLSTGPVSLRGL